MSVGPGSAIIQGQRVPIETASAWTPVGYGARIQAAPASVNTLPPAVGGGGMTGGASTGQVSIGGYGPADNNAAAAIIAGDQPFSFVHSPLPVAILGLVGSLVVLRLVFWRNGDIG